MEGAVGSLIVSPDKSQGYLGFSTVTLPPQRFPFGHDNLKNILVRPFKFGMWVYMGNATNPELQFQGHWWPLKCQILPFLCQLTCQSADIMSSLCGVGVRVRIRVRVNNFFSKTTRPRDMLFFFKRYLIYRG